ncbi:MAG: peptidoglycan editing factor PgeF [Firmicutes bacterium]|uniref:Purine nucleoside phosphorylase n=1 Tax=Melghirimyces thermohalophilus TaxID=1236220 RepID=A0A1G6HRR7_9BACL|nr:peptidoglycan editing factor PgeF [Melghirimyces thermohalophilus]MDA8354428.1 peptidoglycan editing factor PgeF [Bacillota bacterium]SDB96874.1 conserved hypothetical protein [Melghirimyces thermohalophilus]
MEPFQLQDDVSVPYFSLRSWEREFPHLAAGISARDGESVENPNSTNYALHVGGRRETVIQNRKRLASRLGMPFSSWTCGEQVHGVAIREVTSADRGKGRESMDSAFPETDGLLTREPDLLLTSFYADCVPLLFYSPDPAWIGVAHAGWRGTVGKIGSRMVREIVRRGAARDQIHVAIGPSIGGCCYEVDEKVVMPLKDVLPNPGRAVVQPSGRGKWKLDLKEANRQLLLKEGLKEDQVVMTGWCTSCHPDLFHSHRRDHGKTGRMVAFIGMRKDDE